MLTDEQLEAVRSALAFGAANGSAWEELESKTTADLCAAAQDALIDDLHAAHPADTDHRAAMLQQVEIYDALLGTSRRSEIRS